MVCAQQEFCFKETIRIILTAATKIKARKHKTEEHICSPTRYTKCFNERVYSALMLALHVSDLTDPSSGVFLTSCIRRFGM